MYGKKLYIPCCALWTYSIISPLLWYRIFPWESKWTESKGIPLCLAREIWKEISSFIVVPETVYFFSISLRDCRWALFWCGRTTKITINNRRLNKVDFEKAILIPMQEDGLDLYRKEYNNMFLDNQAIVQVAASQEGKGGTTYWNWYGFSSRVEWSACILKGRICWS